MPSFPPDFSLVKSYCPRGPLLPPIATDSPRSSSASSSKAAKIKQLDVLSFSRNTEHHSVPPLSINCNFLRREVHKDFNQAPLYPDPFIDSQEPWSPLSMLYEGILADTQSIADMDDLCHDGDAFPDSPLIDYGRGSSPSRDSNCRYGSLHSESISPSTASTELNTPGTSPQSGTDAVLDLTLAELYAQNALLVAKSGSDGAARLGIPENSLLFQPCHRAPNLPAMAPSDHAALDSSPNVDVDNDDACRFTMPGGGPLFEQLTGEDSFSPFWNSETAPLSAGLKLPDAPVPKLEEAKSVPPSRPPRPQRPPRPKHCSDTLEDFGPPESPPIASPSLRSVRKSPAEYLKAHRRSRNIYSAEGFKVDAASSFKLDPVPQIARINASAKKQADNESINSVASFVSAQSDLTVVAAPLTSTGKKEGNASAQEMLKSEVKVRDSQDGQKREVNSDQQIRGENQSKALRDPTADTQEDVQSRQQSTIQFPASHRILPNGYGQLPQQKRDEASPGGRRPSLLRKISLTLVGRGAELKRQQVATLATDYSKTPRISADLLRDNSLTVTPFPAPPTPITPQVLPRLARSPYPPSSAPAATRNYHRRPSVSQTSLLSPASPSSVLVGRTTRSLSFSTNASRPAVPVTPVIPRKSSLRRPRASSATSNTSSLMRKNSKLSRATIVDSAHAIVAQTKRVTFGKVEEIQVPSEPREVSRGEKQHAEIVEKVEVEEVEVKEEVPDEVAQVNISPSKGFGFGLSLPFSSFWSKQS